MHIVMCKSRVFGSLSIRALWTTAMKVLLKQVDYLLVEHISPLSKNGNSRQNILCRGLIFEVKLTEIVVRQINMFLLLCTARLVQCMTHG